MKITLQNLKDLSGRNDVICSKFVDPINQTLERYKINTPLRVCHFFAQILHESGCFKYMLELASGAEYEGRKDLGNTQPGDGVRFKGRGLIQITGRANYKAFTDSVSNYDKFDFTKTPELLQQPMWATMSAGWFWDSRKLNAIADQDDIRHITLHINGGYNGFDQRVAFLNKAKKLFMPVVNKPVTPVPPNK